MMYPLIGYKMSIININTPNVDYTMEFFTDNIMRIKSENQSEIVEYTCKEIDNDIYLIIWTSNLENTLNYQLQNLDLLNVDNCTISIDSTLISQKVCHMEYKPLEKYICGYSSIQMPQIK